MAFFNFNKITEEDKKIDRYKKERELILKYDKFGRLVDGNVCRKRNQILSTEANKDLSNTEEPGTDNSRTDV